MLAIHTSDICAFSLLFGRLYLYSPFIQSVVALLSSAPNILQFGGVPVSDHQLTTAMPVKWNIIKLQIETHEWHLLWVVIMYTSGICAFSLLFGRLYSNSSFIKFAVASFVQYPRYSAVRRDLESILAR